jgi:hypothetical protein
MPTAMPCTMLWLSDTTYKEAKPDTEVSPRRKLGVPPAYGIFVTADGKLRMIAACVVISPLPWGEGGVRVSEQHGGAGGGAPAKC